MNITLSLGITTKVDAINRVLEAIGSVGINSEEEIDWNIDASSADKMIDTWSQRIQINDGKGWWFNRETFHKFSPDSVTGTIVLPNNTLSCIVKRRGGKVYPITIRGSKLFDTENYGYDMKPLVGSDGKLHCVLIVNLPFEDLPATAKQTIADASRFWFVNDKEGDQIKMNALQNSAERSFHSLAAEDGRQRRRNILSNGRLSKDIYKAGGFNNI